MKLPKQLHLFALALAGALVIGGCGGGSKSANTNTDTVTTTGVTKLSSVLITDADKEPLSGASVKISNSLTNSAKVSTKVMARVTSGTFTTDANGELVIPDGLDPGTYKLAITKDGVTSYVIVTIGNNSKVKSIKTVAPMAKDTTGQWQSIADTAIVASVSGTVYDATSSEPIAGAKVSISGGTATNGAVATSVTDADGNYDLLINVSISKLSAMLNSTLKASADGYESHSITGYQVMNGVATTGLNFLLAPVATSDSGSGTGSITADGEVLFSEDFEDPAAVAGNWTINGGSATGTSPSTNAVLGWHVHQSGLGITNAAVTGGDVLLAPDDTSAGKVPDPAGGAYAAWYGAATQGTGSGDIVGNFMGNEDTSAFWDNDGDGIADPSGGSALEANAGSLTSPSIDLSAVAVDQKVSLTFDSWWEIESVNPNAQGYDRMTIFVSTDGGTTWNAVARLNPLSDPQTAAIRDAQPFSNFGYNAAPMWSRQEAIPLEGVQGNSDIRIRFEFDTVDSMFNGFRGWMIDNVVVQAAEGTFPLLSAAGDYQLAAEPYFYVGWDGATGNYSLSPVSWDYSTGVSTPLTAGQSTAFSATVYYVNPTTMQTPGAKLQMVLKSGSTAVTSPFAATSIGQTDTEVSIGMNGSVAIPSNYGWLDLWVQMVDANGGIITEYPVEYYEIN